MRRIYTAIGLSLIFVAILLLGWLCSSYIIWDGGYLDAEYRITFKDQNGEPVAGIQLQVEDKEGNGIMAFHHLSHFGVEFSGRIRYVFFFFPIEERRGPEYVCRFRSGDKEVHRVSYGELDDWRVGTSEEVAKVKRHWRIPNWPKHLWPKEDETGEAWGTRISVFFDKNKNGRRDPEEAAAQNAFSWYLERSAPARHRGVDEEMDVEFPIVERTIAIQR